LRGCGPHKTRGGDEQERISQAGPALQGSEMITRTVIFSLIALLAWGTLLSSVSGRAAGPDGGGNEGHTLPARPDYATREFDSVRQLQQQGDILPLRAILARARRHSPGRVLDTHLESEHDRYVYAVELVDDGGQVWELKLDARTGELLEDHQEE
jgi:hypothetical protein